MIVFKKQLIGRYPTTSMCKQEYAEMQATNRGIWVDRNPKSSGDIPGIHPSSLNSSRLWGDSVQNHRYGLGQKTWIPGHFNPETSDGEQHLHPTGGLMIDTWIHSWSIWSINILWIRNPLVYHGLSWFIHGLSWFIHGLSMVYPHFWPSTPILSPRVLKFHIPRTTSASLRTTMGSSRISARGFLGRKDSGNYPLVN